MRKLNKKEVQHDGGQLERHPQEPEERLGNHIATGEDVGTRFRTRLRADCLGVASIAEAHIPPSRTDESIRASRKAHIKQLLDTCAVKDWDDRRHVPQERKS